MEPKSYSDVSIVIMDLKGFTGLSSTMTANDLVLSLSHTHTLSIYLSIYLFLSLSVYLALSPSLSLYLSLSRQQRTFSAMNAAACSLVVMHLHRGEHGPSPHVLYSTMAAKDLVRNPTSYTLNVLANPNTR
jgi:hypothetical protein